MKRLFAFAISGLLLCSQSFATTWGEEDTFYTYGNFSSVAFGKKVTAVYMHEGVLKQPTSCNPGNAYWDSTQHVAMKEMDGHFFGKTEIKSGTSECQPSIQGLIIQYWVYFADGTQMQTDPVMVPVEQTGYSSQDAYTQGVSSTDMLFNQTQDISVTKGFRLTYGYAD